MVPFTEDIWALMQRWELSVNDTISSLWSLSSEQDAVKNPGQIFTDSDLLYVLTFFNNFDILIAYVQ